MKINTSLASVPGLSYGDVCARLTSPPSEPLFGNLSLDYVQLVPQSREHLTPDVIEMLRSTFPDTRFRMHANVRIWDEFMLVDLADFDRREAWFRDAATVHRLLDADAFTLHPGRRASATLSQLFELARRCADLFGSPVGIEGMYPTRGAPYLLSTWPEYEALFSSGVPYALDLSHLNIVAHQSGRHDLDLVQAMLSSDRCIEIHVSDNDGNGDQHRVCVDPPWWWRLLDHAHPDAVVFSEGDHR
ncbi:hypothetical protein [Burkholderia gladioli]|uniref:hypothetical protein n=1 Tax=Burkholderia gladioli TaxID=28095 RepID=UPI0034DB2A6C